MRRHAPDGYTCPFCVVVAGGQTQRNRQDDVVYRDDIVTAFVSPKWWEQNPGHVLVVPNEHVENVYEISESVLGRVYSVARIVAVALCDAYACEGTSMRQHNEPAGNQDVWHFHVHVFPRYVGDDLYRNTDRAVWVEADLRAEYASRLRPHLDHAAVAK